MIYHDVQLAGLPGPFHHYGGLSKGNLASMGHALQASSPKLAALECIDLWEELLKRDVKILLMPPHPRPLNTEWCQKNIFRLKKIKPTDSDHIKSMFSSSGMWTANAATFTPDFVSLDRQSHITIANLNATLHRKTEHSFVTRIFKLMFGNVPGIKIHPVRRFAPFNDEGAANHMKLYLPQNRFGIDLFIFDRTESESLSFKNSGILKRQSLLASRRIARLHRLKKSHYFLIRQDPEAIQQGVFHNDVISLCFGTTIIFHEKAFVMNTIPLHSIADIFKKTSGKDLNLIKVDERQIPLKLAIQTYLFNSQVIQLPTHKWLFVAPMECLKHPIASNWLKAFSNRSPDIDEIIFADLKQSMHNGGGPACLRLQMHLADRIYQKIPSPFKLNQTKLKLLRRWVHQTYPEHLEVQHLLNPELLDKNFLVFQQLENILGVHNLYPAAWKNFVPRLSGFLRSSYLKK